MRDSGSPDSTSTTRDMKAAEMQISRIVDVNASASTTCCSRWCCSFSCGGASSEMMAGWTSNANSVIAITLVTII